MSAEPIDKEDIFNQATEITDPAERAAFLDRACGGDAGLRAEFEELLKHDQQAGSFLEEPAVDPLALAPTLPPSPIGEGPGTVIDGRYKLLQQIGEGGMGVVYMAEQTEPVRRKVALKIIKPGMDTRQVIARFEAERQALAMMDHQNIARVLDAGTTTAGQASSLPHVGRPYFVMELVKGVPITEYCDRNQLTVRERTELFVPVCQAIQHAHQKGVIHRDIKPSNVLVTLYDGRPVPKVIDFGVAKAIEQRLTERTMFTQYGQVVGTLEYMSPEQAEMSGLDIDTRSDIYSLGVLLYELLTGSTPISKEKLREAAFIEILRSICEDEPERPSTRLSHSTAALPTISARRKTEPDKLGVLLRGELDWIVMKSLEKDRTRRYESAAGLAADVEHYLKDEPVTACPPSAVYRFRKFASKYRVALATTAGFAALLVVAAVVSTWQAVRATHAEQDARRAYLAEADARQVAERAGQAEADAHRAAELDRQQAVAAEAQAQNERDAARQARDQEAVARQEAEAARQREASLRQQADRMAETRRRRLYAMQIQLAQHEWQAANVRHAIELLEAQIPQPGQAELRGFEWYYLWRLCHNDRQTLTVGSQPVHAVAFSPDGQTIATVASGMAVLWNAETGEPYGTASAQFSKVWCAAYTRDGTRLAVAGLASDRHTGRVAVYDARTRKLLWTQADFPHGIMAVAISPDGATLATGTAAYFGSGGTPATRLVGITPLPAQAEVKLWDIETGEEVRTMQGTSGGILSLDFSADGMLLAAGGWDRAIRVWDVPSGESKGLRTAHSAYVWSVAFSHDGRQLASGAGKWDGPAEIILWDMPDLRQRATLEGHAAGVTAAAFSPDDRTLATASWDRTVKLWDVASQQVRRTLIGHQSYVIALGFSPNGRRLASADWAGTAKLWDTDRALDQIALTAETVGHYSLDFTRNGASLAMACADANLIDLSSGEVVHHFAGHGADTLVAVSPHGSTVATTGIYPATVRLYDASNGELRWEEPGHGGKKIWALCFSPDGRSLATGGEDGLVRIGSVATGEGLRTLEGSGNSVRWLSYSADGTLLAGCCHRTDSRPGSDIRIWDAGTGELKHIIGQDTPGAHSHWVECAAFTPDGKTLATCSHDGTAKLWDTDTWQLRATLKGHHEAIYHLAVSPDSRTLATASWDGSVRLWSIDTGLPLLTLADNRGVVYCVAFSPDGRTLAAGSGLRVLGGPSRRQVNFWCAASDEQVRHDQDETAFGAFAPQPLGHMLDPGKSAVYALAYTPDGTKLACGEATGTVKLVDSATGDATTLYSRPGSPVRSLSYAPDGTRLAAGYHDGSLILITSGPDPAHSELPGHEAIVNCLTFSPDGQWLASGDDGGKIVLWDVPAASQRAVLEGHKSSVRALAFLPAGKTLASCAWDRTVRLWDVPLGKQRQSWEGGRGLASLSGSADARWLATGGGWEEPVVRIWDVATQMEHKALNGHFSYVNGVGFLPEGSSPGQSLLLTCSGDRTVRIWDLSDGQERATIVLEQAPQRLAIDSTGRTFAVAYGSGSIQVFDTQEALRTARPRLHQPPRTNPLSSLGDSEHWQTPAKQKTRETSRDE